LRNGRISYYPEPYDQTAPLGTSYQPTAPVVMPWPRPPDPNQMLRQMQIRSTRFSQYLPSPNTIRSLARGRVLDSQVHTFWGNVVRYVGVGASGLNTRVF